MPITASHDPEVDAVYVRLRDAPTESSVEAHGFVVDLDADSVAIGVEALNLPVDNQRLARAAERFGFLDDLEDIQAAIGAALPGLLTASSKRQTIHLVDSHALLYTFVSGASSTIAQAHELEPA